MKKLSILLLVALLSFSFVACGDDDDDATGLNVNSGTSTLRVNTLGVTGKLYVYNGTPKGGSPIALVNGGVSDWGIPNAPSGLWVLSVVSEADYNANKADPKVSNSLLVFVDSTKATYDIGAGSSGTCELVVDNPLNNYIEIRLDHFAGNLFMTLRPYEHGVKYVQEGNYYLYPIVKMTKQSAGGEILGVYSKQFVNGRQMLNANPDDTPSLNFSALGEINNTPVEALVYIYNQLGDGAEVRSPDANGSLVKSTLGRTIINSGNSKGFVVSMQPDFNQTTGQPLTTTFNKTFVLKGFNKTSEAFTYTFEIGKSYTLTCGSDGKWGTPAIVDIEPAP